MARPYRYGARVRAPVAVAAAVALAAANFLWGLGSSSLFVDEVYSWGDASTPLGDLFQRLRDNEVTPPAYFAALHGWIAWLGAESEWAMRLPSALCAIALVPVLYDLGRRTAGTGAGIAAASFGALSPLVLDYAQQVRGYAPAMLVCALVAACTLRATARGPGAARWAAAAGVLAALAYSIHYTTGFATAPFLGWLLLTRSLPRWSRVAAVAPLAVAVLALAPLMLDQLASGRQAAISPFAHLTFENALSVLGTPWDSRATDLDGLRLLGAAVTVPAIAWLMSRDNPAARAIALAATAPVASSFVATLVSDDALITRYTSISAPFAIVAVGAAVMSLGRAPRAVAVAAAMVVAVSGTIRGHGDGAHFADARGAIEVIARDWDPRDPIVTAPNNVTIDLPILYYAGRDLPRRATVVQADRPELLRQALARASAAWYVGPPAQDVTFQFERLGFDSEPVERFGGGLTPLLLTRAVRTRATSPGGRPSPP
jgi:hypothetical protein